MAITVAPTLQAEGIHRNEIYSGRIVLCAAFSISNSRTVWQKPGGFPLYDLPHLHEQHAQPASDIQLESLLAIHSLAPNQKEIYTDLCNTSSRWKGNIYSISRYILQQCRLLWRCIHSYCGFTQHDKAEAGKALVISHWIQGFSAALKIKMSMILFQKLEYYLEPMPFLKSINTAPWCPFRMGTNCIPCDSNACILVLDRTHFGQQSHLELSLHLSNE